MGRRNIHIWSFLSLFKEQVYKFERATGIQRDSIDVNMSLCKSIVESVQIGGLSYKYGKQTVCLYNDVQFFYF